MKSFYLIRYFSYIGVKRASWVTEVTFIDHIYEVLSVNLETLRRKRWCPTVVLNFTNCSFVLQNHVDEGNLTRQKNGTWRQSQRKGFEQQFLLTYKRTFFKNFDFLLIMDVSLASILKTFIYFLAKPMACGVVVPQPGINLCPLWWKGGVPTPGRPGKYPPKGTLKKGFARGTDKRS